MIRRSGAAFVLQHSARQVISPEVTLAAVVADLADELLGDRSHCVDLVERALERLLQAADATHAALWMITGEVIRPVLHVETPGYRALTSPIEVVAATAVERLRRTGGLICRAGEVSGLEELLPEGVTSYAVAATRQGAVTYALVLGWYSVAPPRDDTTVSQLRIAATLLATALVDRHDVADSVPAPIWMVTADGRLTYGNLAWAEATGGAGVASNDNAADNARWMDLVVPEDRAAATAAFRAAASRRQPFTIEVRLPSANGGCRWWSFIGTPRLTADGRLDGYIGSCRDATESRHGRSDIRAKVAIAQEAERGRIARELHDDLGQQIALLAARLESVTRGHRLSRQRMLAGLVEAQRNVRELATSVHNVSHELHPAKLTLLGLGPTLELLCREVPSDSGTAIDLYVEPELPQVPADTALCVFRVAQEALQNALKHSGAPHIEVSLQSTPTRLVLRVVDNGCGFDPLASGSGLGLLTMRERVELTGGILHITAAPASGTTIEATVPIAGGARRRMIHLPTRSPLRSAEPRGSAR